MKLLVNVSNIRKSGALQVTLSFLEEIKSLLRHDYFIILSEEVEAQIDKDSYPKNFTFYSLSLGAPLRKGFFKKRALLSSLESEINPDCVFSVFGPTYWTPSSVHLAGFAYVWAVNPDSVFIRNLPFRKFLKQKLENILKSVYFKSDSKYLVVETKDVKLRLSKYIGINPANIYVVNNTYNHNFDNPLPPAPSTEVFKKRTDGEFRFITISSNFPHKNLSIIRKVDEELKKRSYMEVYFYVTIPQLDYDQMFAGTKNIINLGVVPAKDCPYLYSQCDALFLPTMLECFTASYPEAMIMMKPILTSDLSFAREICENAAIYFDPLNANDIAEKIIGLLNNKALYSSKVEAGLHRVKDFPTALERADQYLRICEKIVSV